MYFVYILKSLKDGTFYTGLTNNIERRVREHDNGKYKESYSINHKPFKLVYFEELPSRIEARKREKYWKSGTGRDVRDTLYK